ncbi:MAG: pyridoxal-dependent decarboxylase [Endomicrobia bacterium]|nr:pyridoxal-dependent decarboxylase [Endomicrobiia bacterium]
MFINNTNGKKIKKYLHEIVDMGVDFKTMDSITKVMHPKYFKGLLLEPIPNTSMSLKKLYNELNNKIVKFSTNFASKKFCAFPDSGNSVSSIAAALLVPLLNQNMINAEHCSPVASFVEMSIINWLREILGYEVNYDPENIFDIGGIVTLGGTISNTIAMMAARNKAFPMVRENGITFDTSKVKVILPKYISHYSIRCGLSWIGLGEKNIIEADITDEYKIDLVKLKRKIRDYRCDYKIISLVCYAGDSRAMSVDNIEALSDIAQKENLWFHVDACHGFQLAFSDKLKYKIHGISRADSITLDPHKVLFMPYVLSSLLFKNPKDFKLIASNSDLIMKEDFAFGQITPMIGSKSFDSLKLWASIKYFGKNKIGEIVDKRYDLAKFLCKKLQERDNFIVLNKNTDINSVMFMYVSAKIKNEINNNKDISAKEVEKVNAINKKIQEYLFKNNKYYLHTFPFYDLGEIFNKNINILYPMRYMSGNHLLKKSDVLEMIKHIKKVGDHLENVGMYKC